MKKKILLITIIMGIASSAYGIKDDQEKDDVAEATAYFEDFMKETMTNTSKAFIYADKMLKNKRFKEIISRSPKFMRSLIKKSELAADEAVRLDRCRIDFGSLVSHFQQLRQFIDLN